LYTGIYIYIYGPVKYKVSSLAYFHLFDHPADFGSACKWSVTVRTCRNIVNPLVELQIYQNECSQISVHVGPQTTKFVGSTHNRN
jgi:hypothetical protein